MNGTEKVEITKLKNPKAFRKYYDPAKKRKVLIVFDDMIKHLEVL